MIKIELISAAVSTSTASFYSNNRFNRHQAGMKSTISVLEILIFYTQLLIVLFSIHDL